MASKLVSVYGKYLSEKARLRAEARVKLHNDLRPYAQDVAAELLTERKTKTIEQVLGMIGIKNRNVYYDFVSALTEPDTDPMPVLPAEREPEELKYTIVWESDDIARVSIEDDEYLLDHDDGYFDAPEEWLQGTKEQREQYAIILGKVHDQYAERTGSK